MPPAPTSRWTSASRTESLLPGYRGDHDVDVPGRHDRRQHRVHPDSIARVIERPRLPCACPRRHGGARVAGGSGRVRRDLDRAGKAHASHQHCARPLCPVRDMRPRQWRTRLPKALNAPWRPGSGDEDRRDMSLQHFPARLVKVKGIRSGRAPDTAAHGESGNQSAGSGVDDLVAVSSLRIRTPGCCNRVFVPAKVAVNSHAIVSTGSATTGSSGQARPRRSRRQDRARATEWRIPGR